MNKIEEKILTRNKITSNHQQIRRINELIRYHDNENVN